MAKTKIKELYYDKKPEDPNLDSPGKPLGDNKQKRPNIPKRYEVQSYVEYDYNKVAKRMGMSYLRKLKDKEDKQWHKVARYKTNKGAKSAIKSFWAR